jgi:hypothetical protein
MIAGTVREKDFELNVSYRTSCPVSQGRAIDVRSHSDSNGAAGARTERAAAHEMPRWVKIFGVVATIAVAGFAALHLAGGGMGHMAHGNIGAHIMSAEHSNNVP